MTFKLPACDNLQVLIAEQGDVDGPRMPAF